MGSTNSTKNSSKLKAVKALAKSLMGAKKKGAPAKGSAGKSTPAKAAASKSAKVGNAKSSTKNSLRTSQQASMKTSSKKTEAAPLKRSAPALAVKASPHKGPAAPAKTAAAQTKPAAALAKATKALSKRAAGSSKAAVLGGRGNAHDTEAVCREVACEGLSTTAGYCRLHYIKNWKKIKRKELILKEGKLNQYIEELVAKYPDKYIEAIRQDLANDKDFAKVIYDLDLDESVDDFEVEGESVDSLIDTIKRDFDDEGEGGF